MIWKSVAATGILAAIAGCSAEPRSTEYFKAHLDEAKEVVDGCAAGSVRGDECANASFAVEEAKGRDRFRRFLGKKSEE